MRQLSKIINSLLKQSYMHYKVSAELITTLYVAKTLLLLLLLLLMMMMMMMMMMIFSLITGRLHKV